MVFQFYYLLFLYILLDNDDEAQRDFNLQACDDVSGNHAIDEERDSDVIYEPNDRRTDRSSRRPSSFLDAQSIRSHSNFKSWFTSSVSLPETLIVETCGKDALFYLRFQRHIIFFLFIVMLLSICAILPINLQGKSTQF